jgi:hypothetical protein
MANRTEYLAEYGALLHSRGIKVDDATSAALVRRALEEIYGFALGGEDVRRSKSQWYLGYNQHPWRATSSYEEIREASYYVLITNTEGLVTKGRLVNEVLERRKVAMPTPPAPSTTSLTDRALWETEVGLGNSEVGILTHRHIRLEIRSQFAVRVRSGSHEISRSGCSSRISRWRRLTRRVRLGRKAVRTLREPDHLHLTRSFLRVVGASASRSEVEPKADSQVAHFNARLRGTAREGVVAPNSAIVDLSAV